MGRKALSIGVLSFLGLVSAAVAGTFHPDFNFFASESNNYSPLRSYYAPQHQQQQKYQPSSYERAVAAPTSSQFTRPVVRKNRGIEHTHTYISASPLYVSKAALYYPEATVFSDPLPIVPLPQLPSEFLTLKTSQVSTGAYGGSENEVPKKSSKGRKGRRGKKGPATPAPVDEEDEDEDDAQETEADSESGVGGYPSSKSSQRQQSQPRNRQREEGATGGYPSSFDANAVNNVNNDRESQSVSSKSRSRSNSRGRSNRNRGNSQEVEDDTQAPEEIEGDEEDDEIMMTGDDTQGDEENARDDAAEIDAEQDAVPAEEEEEEEEEAPKRGRSKSQGGRTSRKRGGKKAGRGKGRSRGSAEDDDETALNAALLDEGQKIDTIYVPTFGNNVLNTVFPAYSQNALLKSLESQMGLGNEGYPESGQDVSAISIAADDDQKKRRKKTKKRTSPRKNRPGSRGRSSSRRSRNRQASNVRAQEPDDQNQGGYDNPSQQQQSQGNNQGGYSSSSQQQSQGNQGQSQQYGPPQFTPGTPNSEYIAPSSQGSFRSQGINPPPQSNQGGYRTINNELRGRTSDLPSQRLRQQPQQEYGAPLSSGSQRSALIEPRQLSQASIVAADNDQFSTVADSNNPVTSELIRTVQAILQRYPN